MTMSIDELNRLIAAWENATTEFKRDVSEDVLRDTPKDLAALANSEGGRIIYGVSDEKDPVGLVLTGKERERISQQARNCRPAVRIDFEEVPFGQKRFLVVRVPRSTVIHSDADRRFPIRIGDTTDYLDALGLLALMRERNLLGADVARDFGIRGGEERGRVTADVASTLANALESGEPLARAEALRDLGWLAVRHAILEDELLSDALKAVVTSRETAEVRLGLEAIYNAANSGTDMEREVVTSWVDDLLEVGRTARDGETARRVCDILQRIRSPSTVDLMVYWVRDADDETFKSLGFPTILQSVGFAGLNDQMRVAMYGILSTEPSEVVKGRATVVLDAVRRAYG